MWTRLVQTHGVTALRACRLKECSARHGTLTPPSLTPLSVGVAAAEGANDGAAAAGGHAQQGVERERQQRQHLCRQQVQPQAGDTGRHPRALRLACAALPRRQCERDHRRARAGRNEDCRGGHPQQLGERLGDPALRLRLRWRLRQRGSRRASAEAALMRWQRRRALCRRAGRGGARGNTKCGGARCWRLTTGRGAAFSPRCDLVFHSHPGGLRHGAPRAMAHRARMIIVDIVQGPFSRVSQPNRIN